MLYATLHAVAAPLRVGLTQALGTMQTFVATLIRFDTYRDGGSMSTSFLDDADLRHTLMFKIRLVPRSTLDLECARSYTPEHKIYRRADYTSPITGKSYEDWATETISISWDEALRILEALRPHVLGFQTNYLDIFTSMLKIAQSHCL